MSQQKREMKLGLFFLPSGHHMAAWRHPDAQRFGVDVHRYKTIVETAERGLMDLIFIADVYGNSPDLKWTGQLIKMEPVALLSALAMASKHIGLVGTVSTTYNEPYNVARQFASLDHISGGRAGWNIVTTYHPTEGLNYGKETLLDASARYNRALEFVNVVQGLWDCWEDDAFIRDREAGIYFDTDKMRMLNHKGQHFQVQGPMNLPRSPQGHPILVQAGSSGPGRDLAAHVADIIFTVHRSLASAQAFYTDVKQRAASFGRDPAHVFVMPGALIGLGESRQHALDRYQELQALIHPDFGLSGLSMVIGMELAGMDVDGPLPDVPLESISSSRARGLFEMARKDNLSIRQVYEQTLGSRGHWQLFGTVKDIVDQLEEWFLNGAADGFNIMQAVMPGDLEDFVNLVIPELQRRGLYRTAYQGTTLRENLGIPRPDARADDQVPSTPLPRYADSSR